MLASYKNSIFHSNCDPESDNIRRDMKVLILINAAFFCWASFLLLRFPESDRLPFSVQLSVTWKPGYIKFVTFHR